MVLDGGYNAATEIIFLSCWSSHVSFPSISFTRSFWSTSCFKESPFFFCLYGHLVKIFACLLFPPFCLPPHVLLLKHSQRLPLLAALFWLCPFSPYACILPCVCLANDLLLLLQLSFVFCFSSKRHSWQMSAFKSSQKKPGSKNIQPYILCVCLSIVFSLIQHCHVFLTNNSNSINDFSDI